VTFRKVSERKNNDISSQHHYFYKTNIKKTKTTENFYFDHWSKENAGQEI